MKKVYSKPEIMFDDFSLTTCIAAGCEEKIQGPTQGNCGLKWGQTTIFTQDSTGCQTKVADGSPMYGNLCYHNPDQKYNVFNS